jgi:hypothetical protein
MYAHEWQYDNYRNFSGLVFILLICGWSVFQNLENMEAVHGSTVRKQFLMQQNLLKQKPHLSFSTAVLPENDKNQTFLLGMPSQREFLSDILNTTIDDSHNSSSIGDVITPFQKYTSNISNIHFGMYT